MYEDQTKIWEITWSNNIVKIIRNKRDTMLVKEYPGPRSKEQITPNRGGGGLLNQDLVALILLIMTTKIKVELCLQW